MRTLRRLACSATIVASLAAAPAWAQDHIKIGAVISLTGGAAESSYALDVGARMAVQEINQAGGINGHQVDYVVADDQTDPTMTINQVRRLLNDKINFLLGPQFGTPTMAAAPILTEARVANIAITSSIPDPAKAPYTFSILYPLAVRSSITFDYLTKTRGYKSVALIGDDSSNSRETMQPLAEMLKKAGVTVTGYEVYQFKSDDITPQLLSLRRGNPQALFADSQTPGDFATILKGIHDLNWNIPVSGTFTAGSAGAYLAKVAGAEAMQNLEAQLFKGHTYCAGDPLGTAPYAKFLVRIKAFVPKDAGRISALAAGMAYDSVMLFKDAAAATGSTDGAKIAGWIEQNAQHTEGVSGTFAASPTEHHLIGAPTMVFGEHIDQVRADGLIKRAGC